MNPIVNEYIFSQTFKVEEVSTTVTASFGSSPAFPHLGHTLSGRVRHLHSRLDVYLQQTNDINEPTTITYGVRLINGDHVVDIPSKACKLSLVGTIPGHYGVISWKELLANFCTDGISGLFVLLHVSFLQANSRFTLSFERRLMYRRVFHR